MIQLTEKLKSRRGASLLIALLFFLLASMVGAVIMASATANVDRVSGREKQRQDYLALSSAIQLLRETFDGLQGTAWEQKTVYGCASNTNIVGEPARHSDKMDFATKLTLDGDSADGDGKLQKLLADTAFAMYRTQMVYLSPKPSAPSMPIRFTIEGEDMPAVEVSLTMSRNYNLTMELRVRDSAESATVSVKASATTQESTPPEADCGHNCQRNIINDDGTPGTIVEWATFHTTVYRNTLSVGWGRATVIKGVLSDG